MFETWSEIYSNSAVWRSIILYAHLGGLLIGGGAAVTMDRMTLQASPSDPRQLTSLAGAHRVVLGGLASIAASGLLMLAANFDTYIVSPWYWTKMALVVLLLLNGIRLTRAERAASAGEPSAWGRLRGASMTSLALWLSIALFGAILPNV